MSENFTGEPFILTGMHRSGTSLAASLLQGAGISMGERLAPADVGNVKGHFEDRDFLDLQIAILKRNQMHWNGWTTEPATEVAAEFRERAVELVKRKQARHAEGMWGWKDPRTTLFLDFWHSLVPGGRFVFIYRSPWEVMDSLARRGTDPEILSSARRILELWAFYNRQILRFAERYPEQTLLISNDVIADDPGALVQRINRRFGTKLAMLKETGFEAGLMVRASAMSWHAMAVNDFDPSYGALFNQLRERAGEAKVDLRGSERGAGAEALMSEWLAQRAGEIRIRHLQTALEKSEKRANHLEQMLTPQQVHSANLERYLETQKKHASNLEQLLAVQQTHSQNLEQALAAERAHSGNLEKMLTALKAHVTNLEGLANYQGQVAKGQ